MTTRVKICGLTRETDIEAAVAAGADATGIVCDVPVDTHREVSVDRASELAATVPPFVTSVLVTMPGDRERAIDLVDRVSPDAVQIHERMEPADLAAIRSATGTPLLLAVDADDLALEPYDDVVDAFVVDSVDAAGGGGTGETHDWERTREATANCSSPIVLAGGLTPENVAEAVRTVEPFAVDVASGVEADDGSKDPEAVRSFVDRATSVDDRVTIDPEP